MNIQRRIFASFAAIVVVFATSANLTAQLRTWTDSTGKYTIEGEVLARDYDTVVLQKNDKSLVIVDVEQLSDGDQKFLESDKFQEQLSQLQNGRQFKLRNGFEVTASVVEYGKRDLSIRRRRGKVYVNDKLFDNILPVYKKMIPAIVSNFEKNEDLKSEEDFEKWIRKQGAKAKSYEVSGVMLEMATGDLYGVPFFMFSDSDLAYLKPGWNEWLKSENDSKAKQEYELGLRAQAVANKREQAARNEVTRLHLMLQAADAGATDLWNVTLIPPNGYRKTVVVAAQNSNAARQLAARKFPTCRVAGVARKR